MKIGHKVPPHGGNGKLPGGIPIMRLHHKDGVSTDRTGKPVYSVNQLRLQWIAIDCKRNAIGLQTSDNQTHIVDGMKME